MRSPVFVLLPIFAVCLMLSGCGGGDSSGDQLIADANKTNLDRVCTLYLRFQMSNQGAGPADEATFKTYISGLAARQLERIGVDSDNVDAIFVSDRDNERFEILWGIETAGREQVAIVAEKTGVDGMRMVGFNRKPHREVDEAEYKKLFGQ